MPIPHTFIPGEVARATEVNENFAFIMSVLGPLTTPGRTQTTTEFLMGARQNVLLTGTHDSGPEDMSFFQISWNGDWNYTNGKWRWSRFVNNYQASAIRIGMGGVEVYGTSRATGNLDTQMTKIWGIHPTSLEGDYDFMYFAPSWHITNVDYGPTDIDHFRLLYTPLLNPTAIYDGGPLSKATTTKPATDFGVPSYAKAINISVEATAASGADAIIRFFTNRTNADFRHGFSVAASAGKTAAGNGVVPLGTTAGRLGEFKIERTADFSDLKAYVTGYWA